MEMIDARLKFAHVLSTRASLEAVRLSAVWIEPARVPVELELNERNQRRLSEHEVYLVTFDKLLDLGIGHSKGAAEIIAQY